MYLINFLTIQWSDWKAGGELIVIKLGTTTIFQGFWTSTLDLTNNENRYDQSNQKKSLIDV